MELIILISGYFFNRKFESSGEFCGHLEELLRKTTLSAPHLLRVIILIN
jgi:hypothetical protein